MWLKCKHCGVEFKTYDSKRKFCSRRCFREWMKKMATATLISQIVPISDKDEEK